VGRLKGVVNPASNNWLIGRLVPATVEGLVAFMLSDPSAMAQSNARVNFAHLSSDRSASLPIGAPP